VRILVTIGLLAIIATSCATAATDEEVAQMCEHLAELRGEATDRSTIRKCIVEAKADKVSQRQAMCRISAVNLLEYWNRCRTGAARTP
jgi:hypothetical protein